jgi:hypothetical protein
VSITLTLALTNTALNAAATLRGVCTVAGS